MKQGIDSRCGRFGRDTSHKGTCVSVFFCSRSCRRFTTNLHMCPNRYMRPTTSSTPRVQLLLPAMHQSGETPGTAVRATARSERSIHDNWDGGHVPGSRLVSSSRSRCGDIPRWLVWRYHASRRSATKAVSRVTLPRKPDGLKGL